MYPSRGKLRPGRGDDFDLEALQDAFMRSAEKPSAKVTRSKPPSIKAGFALGLERGKYEADGKNTWAAAPPAANPACTAPSRSSQEHDNENTRRYAPAGINSADEWAPTTTSASPPAGGMMLNAPGVVSSSVLEREVKAPAPMRIGNTLGGLGDGGGGDPEAGGTRDKRRSGRAGGGPGAGVWEGPIGGFPSVRHRSEMGLIKLGGRAAATRSAPAPAPLEKSVVGGEGGGGGEGTTRGGSNLRGIPSDIHEENLSRVSAMSPEEIAQAQQEIRAALPPGALEMLMRRRKTKGAAAAAAPTAGAAGVKQAVANTMAGEKVGDAHADAAKKPSAVVGTTFNSAAASDADTARARPVVGTPGATAAGATAAGATVAGATAAAAIHSAGGERAVTRGAPTGSQRAATAAGGIDSKKALEAALLTLPLEERAKTSWTLSGGDAANRADGGSGDGGDARVDLDGVAVPAGAEGGGREALHHHGDDPDRAGYTPSELVRLARSTVSGQRQLAMRALAGVLRIRATCVARGLTPPHTRLPEMVPVAIRLCLDDASPSVVAAALNATEAFLAPLARDGEEEERALQGLSWVDYQAFPSEARPLCTPGEKAALPPVRDDGDGEDEEGDETDNREGAGGRGVSKTVGELARLCYEDPCRGFLQMSLLPKIMSMIKSFAGEHSTAAAALCASRSSDGGDRGSASSAGRHQRTVAAVGSLHPRAARSCLRVLHAVASRSPWAAECVAREPGLVDAVREAFLEPRADGTLPFDLSEAAVEAAAGLKLSEKPSRSPSPPPPPPRPVRQRSSTTAGLPVRVAAGEARSSPPEQLPLLAVRLVRVLVQSRRGVALFLSRTHVLGSTKGLLALGQGLARPVAALEAVQREVLELWRCCLSYGIDVAAADTVVLVARGQGWLPGLAAAPPAAVAGAGAGVCAGAVVGNTDIRGGGGGEHGLLPPRLAFYRALHQLACACVLPPGVGSVGRAKSGDGADAGGGKADEQDRRAAVGRAGEAAAVPVGGVTVIPESLADVGDTVDAAVEAAILWLSRGDGRGGGGGANTARAPERAVQAAAIHLVACWVERYRVMTRTGGRRPPSHLESTAEDAAVLFSSLLASPASPLPAAVTAAATATAAFLSGDVGDVISNGSTREGGGNSSSGGRRSCGQNEDSSSSLSGGTSTAAAATAIAGLDWLAGICRLGLACEKAAPGEAAAALASAPEATSAALADFLASAGVAGSVEAVAATVPPESVVRRVRRAEARARWLACRLMACRGGGSSSSEVGGSPWIALRRDCALQGMPLSHQGDEAVAVGLLAEALPDVPVDGSGDMSAKAGVFGVKDPVPAGASTSLLRKLFRGAISDSMALSQSSFHLDGRWASLQSLRACAPPGAASILPLPQHWLFLPLASQGGENAATAAVSACLSVLVHLERERSAYVCTGSGRGRGDGCGSGSGGGGGGEGGLVPPEVKLYHLANACLYGASVLSGIDVDRNFNWLFSRYLEQCGTGFEGRLTDVIARLALASAPDPAKMIAAAAAASGRGASAGSGGFSPRTDATARDRARAARAQSHAERALLEFVKDLVASFLADSFGIPSFARVLRMFVRTGFPAAARRVVWKELGDVGLLHLLDAPAAATSTPPFQSSLSLARGDGSEGGSGGGSSRDPCADDAYLYPGDIEGAIIETYLAALEHPRFGPSLAALTKGPLTRREERGAAAEEVSLKQEEAADPTAAAPPAAAAKGELNTGGQGYPNSTFPVLSMWEIAVHHLACYFFSPSAATATAYPVSVGKSAADHGERQWQPDFGRRKAFERLLRSHERSLGERGGGDEVVAFGSAAAAAVLGHECPGTATAAAAAVVIAAGKGEADGLGQGEYGGCAWRSRLEDERRRVLLQAYCRASGGGGEVVRSTAVPNAVAVHDDGAWIDSCGGEAGDIVTWLNDEREVEDVVERLARAIGRG